MFINNQSLRIVCITKCCPRKLERPIYQYSQNPSVTKAWRIALVILGLLSCAAAFTEASGVWNNYVFDMSFPAYLYILLRGIHNGKPLYPWSARFSPTLLFCFIVGISFLVESLQYFGYYKGYFDSVDYLAYLSILLPCYLLDKFSLK